MYSTDQTTYNTTNWRTSAGQTFSAASGGKTSNYGIYVEDEMAIGESTLLTLGARYDKWKAYDGYISKQSGLSLIHI